MSDITPENVARMAKAVREGFSRLMLYDHLAPQFELLKLDAAEMLEAQAARIADLERQLAEKEEQLVSVLQREAATAKRHDDRTDKLERQLAEARDKALEEAALIATRAAAYHRVTAAAQGPGWGIEERMAEASEALERAIRNLKGPTP